MRIVALSLSGNVFSAIKWVNDRALGQHLLQVDCRDGYNTVAVFKFPSYQDYLRYCEKTKQEPMSTDDYFN